MAPPPLTSQEAAQYNQTYQPALYGSLITFLILSNSAVLVRILTQLRTRNKLSIDDYLALLSLAFVDSVIAVLLTSTHYGLGLHTWRIVDEDPKYPHNLAETFMYVWISMVFTGPTLASIKLSLLFFYRRIFLVHQRFLFIFWWGNLIYVILWFIGATGFYLFQCWPVGWYWNQFYPKYGQTPPDSPKSGQCSAQNVHNVALPIIFSLISDVAILILPLTAISQLQMTSKLKKWGIAGLFSVGVLACALELARILVLVYNTNDKDDPSWSDVPFLILSAAAESVGLICACLPIICPQLPRELRNPYAFWKQHSRARNSGLAKNRTIGLVPSLTPGGASRGSPGNQSSSSSSGGIRKKSSGFSSASFAGLDQDSTIAPPMFGAKDAFRDYIPLGTTTTTTVDAGSSIGRRATAEEGGMGHHVSTIGEENVMVRTEIEVSVDENKAAARIHDARFKK